MSRFEARLTATRRAALAVAHRGGSTVYADLTGELAACLGTAVVYVAAFTDESRTRLAALAAVLDGQPLPNFEYRVRGSPCEPVFAAGYRYLERGLLAELPPGELFAAAGLDSYAAFPLSDSAGASLGLLVAMDREPIAGGDSEHAETLLKIFAGRLAAEIERGRSDAVLRAAALAVSSAHGDTVFAELARLLATVLQVETALIARYRASEPGRLQVLAMHVDGEPRNDDRYPIAGTPCATVLGQRFRAYPQGLLDLFPDDEDLRAQGAQSYAGHPLTARDGSPLGIVSITSRRRLEHVGRVESMLQIFAVRAAAEIERLRADEALRQSEASYRAIFEASEDAIFVHDWDSGAVLDVNPKACETYGYSQDELRGISVADISSGVAPYTLAEAAAKIAEAKLGRGAPFEWHRRNKDGSLHWDEVRLKPALIGGKPHVLAFTRDITARKLAEERLRVSEEQYRGIFEASADALLVWSEDLQVLDANPAFFRMYDARPEQILGLAYRGFFAPAHVEERLATIRRALAGEALHFEAVAWRGGTEPFDVEMRLLPFRLGGRPHALGVARDITERRRHERALQRSEAHLRATVEAAFDGVIAMDDAGRIVEFNAAAERIFGHRRDAVLGRPLADVLLPLRHRAAHERGLRHFHDGGHGPMIGRLVETAALRADGSEFPVELAISVAQAPEGGLFVGHLRDISARRAAEAERAALESQLRQAQKMEAIGQLTGGLAHDFNNILTSVIGYLVLSQERAETLGDATLQRQLGQAQIAGERARDLIGQLLTFARRQRRDKRALELGPLVQQAVQLLRATLPSSIALDGPADAPGAAPLCVQADAVQLEQVLFNLCINARDAIDGTGSIRVALRRVDAVPGTCASCRAPPEEGAWVELSVADTGRGIDPRVLERMFEPFYSTKEVGRGSGMGLAMVHGIVHEHGGHVVVESARGEGSVFRVLLPALARGPAAEPAAGAHRAPRDATPLRGRVLVVEDEPMVGDFMAELLGGWGLDVELMRDSQAAEARLDAAQPALDLLVTDQTMPRLTGMMLARRATQRRPGLPVLLYTGGAAEFDADELHSHGVRAVLRKPIVAQELRRVVERLLE